jgi:hypothetical protein
VSGFRHVSHSGLGGCGDGMQVVREGDALYVAHYGKSGMGTTVLDVSAPAAPRVVLQLAAPPGTHTHKVQVADGLMLVNEERFRESAEWSAGLVVYDVSEPLAPRRIGRWECGGDGVHRIVWTGGRYAQMSATPPGHSDRIWVVVDLADPEHPVEAGRWELEEPAPPGKRYAAHHALAEGDLAFMGYCDAGLVVLDVADATRPRTLGRVAWEPGGGTHTCLPLPGRRLVVVTDEQLQDGPGAPRRYVRVVDVSDPAAPRIRSVCPEPGGEFDALPLRYGPHNLHENRAGSYRSARLAFVTYFNAGLRVYDLADPERPAEVAWWVPDAPAGQGAAQTNDLFVEAGARVWLTDRFAGGLDCLEPEEGLAALMREASLPS